MRPQALEPDAVDPSYMPGLQGRAAVSHCHWDTDVDGRCSNDHAAGSLLKVTAIQLYSCTCGFESRPAGSMGYGLPDREAFHLIIGNLMEQSVSFALSWGNVLACMHISTPSSDASA